MDRVIIESNSRHCDDRPFENTLLSNLGARCCRGASDMSVACRAAVAIPHASLPQSPYPYAVVVWIGWAPSYCAAISLSLAFSPSFSCAYQSVNPAVFSLAACRKKSVRYA